MLLTIYTFSHPDLARNGKARTKPTTLNPHVHNLIPEVEIMNHLEYLVQKTVFTSMYLPHPLKETTQL